MKRKITCLILTLVMCISMSSAVFAFSIDNNNDDDEISFDEYYSELKAEYAKYDIGFEIAEPNYEFTYTKALLDEQKVIARDYCENLTIKEVRDEPTNDLKSIQPRAMPVNYYWGKTFYINSNAFNVPSFLEVRVAVNGQVNVQNGLVMSCNGSVREVNSINLEQNNLYVSTKPTNNQHDVYVMLRGSVRFAWTDPLTNSVHRATVNEPFFATSFDPQRYT